jgi:L-aspartate oxidase
LIPIAPAAHYFMGGVVAGIDGRTSMSGLLAVGEVSCTGVHGANRLANNSLLEGLVFGINAADMITESPLAAREQLASIGREPDHSVPPEGTGRLISRLQQSMSTGVGGVRTTQGLLNALEQIPHTSVPAGIGHHALTLRNMVQLAGQIAVSALEREESRGGHIRDDFPETDPLLDGQHQLVQRVDGSVIRSFGALHHEVIST